MPHTQQFGYSSFASISDFIVQIKAYFVYRLSIHSIFHYSFGLFRPILRLLRETWCIEYYISVFSLYTCTFLMDLTISGYFTRFQPLRYECVLFIRLALPVWPSGGLSVLLRNQLGFLEYLCSYSQKSIQGAKKWCFNHFGSCFVSSTVWSQ